MVGCFSVCRDVHDVSLASPAEFIHAHLGAVDRDRKADAVGALAHQRVDPHHFPPFVHQGPAAVARVDGRVR